MIKIIGKLSTFGGPLDQGMTDGEGCAAYEHSEADRRPDLFVPRSSDFTQGTGRRLRTDSFYIAVRYPKDERSRDFWQKAQWRVINPRTGQWVACSLVDWGPAESTGRVVDASPAVARALRVETNDEVEVQCLTF